MNVPLRLDPFLHFLLAEEMGEFEKENLTVEFVALPSADAIPQLASGDIEALASSWSAANVNAIEAGVEMRAVLELGAEQPGGQGVWVNNDILDEGPAALEGAQIGTATGAGSVSVLFIEEYLQEAGLDITDVELVQLPAAEVPLAMQNNVVSAAWVTSPAYLEIADFATWVSGAPTDFSGGAVYFGPELLNDQPEVAEAFVRAVLRTVNTYLQGDYKADPEILPRVAAALETEEEVIQRTPSMIFDPNGAVNTDLLVPLQEIWLKIPDILRTSEPLPPEQLFDVSIVERVLAGG